MQAPSPHEPVPPSASEGPRVDQAPIRDPYLSGDGLPAQREQVSMLAVVSLAALCLGPLGAIAAMVFGWAGRREIERSEPRRTGYGLATLGLALGAIFTMG